MFEVGFWELVLVFGVGLVVLGPERLPKVAAQIGRWAGQARRMARNLSNQIQAETRPVESSLQAMDQSLRKDFSALRPEPGQSMQPEQKSTKESADRAGEPVSGPDIDSKA
jgi:sec-independent protein translocase protein TatB